MITPTIPHPICSEIRLKHEREKTELMKIDYVILEIVKRWKKNNNLKL